MYLKGSQYRYNGRKRRSSPLRIFILFILVAAGLYFSIVIVPETQPLFIPTNTPTTPPEAYLVEAEQLEREGRFSRAIELYQKAIDSDPKNTASYINIAKLQVFESDYSDAVKNAENAILLNSNNAVAHAIRAWALGKQGNYLDAETAFTRSMEIDPNNALMYAYRTEILVDQFNAGQDSLNTLEKATEYSRLAISNGNNLMEAHRARGLLLEITGNYEDAINEFQIAISINPNLADLYLALGRNLRAAEKDADAITAFERARSLNPYDPWAPYYISRTYSGNGEYAKAIQQAEDAIKLAPTETSFYWNLGTQYYRSEKFQQALDNFKLAIQGGTTADGQVIEGIPLSYDNRVPELYYMYGLVLARSGQCQEATEIVRLIIQGIPDNTIAVENANYMTDVCKSGQFDITLSPAAADSDDAAASVPEETMESELPESGTEAEPSGEPGQN